jgi:transforming growth factor-beta-induced protein
MKRLTLLITTLILGMLIVACGATEEPTPTPMPEPEPVAEPTPAPVEEEEVEEAAPTIVEIAVEDGRFTTLVAAVQAAGLVDTLNSDGPFTVFAPTDDAFAALPDGTVETLLADPEGDLTQILLYHVVGAAVPAADVVELDSATTVQGEEISIEVVDGSVILNGAVEVIITDIEASNGIIHVIDAVLLPPSLTAEELPSIAEIAAGDENFSILVTALDAAGLVDVLAGAGDFTVFAPTNEAFDALPEGTIPALLEDPEGDLTQILLYHVVEGIAMAQAVIGLDNVETLQGEEISIEVIDGSVILNGEVEVIITDIAASNGVIHVIDGVLLPPAMMPEAEELLTIAEIAAADENFSILVTALDAAGLVETFAGEGEFTVFAPTNDAFNALPDGTLEALLEDPTGDLTNILLYHVVEGAVLAETVVTLDAATTLLGEDVTITVTEDGRVLLNDSVEVIITDIIASNGVIHVIDAVLLPGS